VLAWHREAAQELFGDTFFTEAEVATIIAAHDPHAETVRLLGEANLELKRLAWHHDINISGYSGPDVNTITGIEAHLAKLKGTQ